jgi:hypothetical protein
VDQTSTPDTAVDTAEPPNEGTTGRSGASSEHGYDQWQGPRLLFGLGVCTLFVILAIVYEKCG